jgi:hypothetical protein
MKPTCWARAFVTALLASWTLVVGPTAAEPARRPAPPTWLDGFDRDADNLPRAIATLERGGGLVTEIRFDGRGGHPGFDATVERGGRVAFVRLERGGARDVVLTRRRRPAWMQRRRIRQQLSSALHAKVSLAAAVQQAEGDTGDLPAVAAAVATRASDPLRYAPAYNVLLLTPQDTVQRVAVDAITGLSIADVGALAAWPQPGP